jgi:hypothetical protein
MNKYEGNGLPEIFKNGIEMEAAFGILDMLYLNPKEDDIYRRRWLLFL